jgi:hypothetical protein
MILTPWEAEIGRIAIQGQPGHGVHETSSQWKKTGHGGACLSF